MSENETTNKENQPVVQASDAHSELEAFNKIVSAIKSLHDPDTQMRVFKSVLTFLGWADAISKRTESHAEKAATTSSVTKFSEDRNLTAKQFIFEKKPTTDIERVACLAYYLTHYLNTAHFKTLDLSKLNTDAAQVKLSNAAKAVDNATTAGLLASAGNAKKQLSAVGEIYVQALPDREAAKAALAHVRPRRKSKRSMSNNEDSE